MKKTLIFLMAIIFFLPVGVFAQENASLTLSITPPLVKVNVDPGDTWTSFHKVVNNNPTELTVYAQVLDFKSKDKGGVQFLPKIEGADYLLSNWIDISLEPFTIPAYKSIEIPFTVTVPKDAAPGGHYAAILAGTRPLNEKIEGSGIKVSSMVSSLILLNVQGEVIESGDISEFSTPQSLYKKAEVDFTLGFKNTGNVHIQPQGNIKIYNFLGKERGSIEINQKTEFGNILPESSRKWDFTWKGEDSILEIGRYKAQLSLEFGEDAVKTVNKIIYFWVIPLKLAIGVLGGFFIFFIILFIAIKIYIRKAIRRVQERTGAVSYKEAFEETAVKEVKERKVKKTKKASDSETTLDLRSNKK